MNPAESALRAGNPKAALAALSEAVRAEPAKAALRVFLAQLLCVLGDWQRAHTQLNVATDLDPEVSSMREMVGHALRCEKLRAEVFAGKRAPMVFGQPDAWLALLIESLLRAGQGEAALAESLAANAFESAPATAGRIDGTAFSWIADADSRLGPVLEAIVNGRYYWIPFSRLARVDFEPPVDLRDVVWIPAHLVFSNGGEAIAMVPVRYPGTELSADGALLLARRTEWQALAGERWTGIGQRVLATDQGEYGLLDIRALEFDGTDEAAPDAAEVAGG
ncbi:MAG: tetratricopeptide repeat protein [Pseudomonadota bacterium]|nr:tetratricopeptide repeat protein [Pseudomonadota bacterium]